MNNPLIHPNAQPLWNDHRNARALASRGRMPTPKDDPGELIEDEIKDAIIELDEHESNCCRARFLGETDFCSDCKEHAVAQFEYQIDRENLVTVTYDKNNRDILEIEQA